MSDEPGTTRDRHFARAEWNGRAFWLVDTGGLTDDPHIPMDVEIRKQVIQAIAEADLLLFVVDAKVGLHPQDHRIVEILRDARKPWVLVANKVDDPRTTDFYEFYNLGAGDPVPVSAQNGKNSGDLLDVVVDADARVGPVEAPEAVRVAVIGRPNVGKSSLVNRLLGEERLVVSDIAGTTRDAIDTPMRYHGRELIFVDTAGLRRQSKIDDGIEFYSSLRTRRAIERADICVLVIDATTGLENQDLKIATMAWESGCGLIIVVNKWDIGGQGRQDLGEVREGDRREGAVSRASSPSCSRRRRRGSGHEGARAGARGGRRAAEAHHDLAGERGARRARRAAPAAAGGGARDQAHVRDAGERRAADLRRVRQPSRSRRRALRALSAQRLPREVGLHRHRRSGSCSGAAPRRCPPSPGSSSRICSARCRRR